MNDCQQAILRSQHDKIARLEAELDNAKGWEAWAISRLGEPNRGERSKTSRSERDYIDADVRVSRAVAEANEAIAQRDAAIARAKMAEEKLKPDSSLNQQAGTWQRIASHPAIRPALFERGRSYSDLAFERITQLAEAAQEAVGHDARVAYAESDELADGNSLRERVQRQAETIRRLQEKLCEYARAMDP